MDADGSQSTGGGTGGEGAGVVALGPLLALELGAILAFIAAGELRHGIDPLRQTGHVLMTASPFLAGWLLVGGLVGAYDERARSGVRAGLRIAVGAWVGGAAVGLTLRGTDLLPGAAPLSFALVMTGLGAVVVGGVRAGAIYRFARCDRGQRPTED